MDCGEKEQDTVCVLCTQHVRSVGVDITHVPGFDEGHHIILFRYYPWFLLLIQTLRVCTLTHVWCLDFINNNKLKTVISFFVVASISFLILPSSVGQ